MRLMIGDGEALTNKYITPKMAADPVGDLFLITSVIFRDRLRKKLVYYISGI